MIHNNEMQEFNFLNKYLLIINNVKCQFPWCYSGIIKALIVKVESDQSTCNSSYTSQPQPHTPIIATRTETIKTEQHNKIHA